jgi:RHS repeat-associated protein
MASGSRARSRHGIALAVSAVLAGALLQGTVPSPAAHADDLPKVPASEKALSGHGVKVLPRRSDGEPRVPEQPPERTWPKAASATVTVPRSTAGKAARARAGSLPVSLASAKEPKGPAFSGRATVRLLDHEAAERAGVDGVLLSIEPGEGATGGTADVSLDYSSFSQTFGGAYAARLRLTELPACALTTPGKRGCTTPERVASHNDEITQTLTAPAVTLPHSSDGVAEPVVFAATAGTSSDHGDYTASQLSPSATWQTSLNTGSFSWSYNMPVPDVPGSFTPKVGLSYSSDAIDGRTTNTNNQSSWVGDGFDLWPGYIERRYKSCADDGITTNGEKPGDLCWGYDNAAISFAGHAGELIPAGSNLWKIKGDDGTRIEHLTGTTRDNGDNDQEYWKVTTTDGFRYYFGYHKLPGWATGKETTDSTWTVPVYGDDSGEPCHAATFADSWCQQAWRWNLDYAVDPHGNAVAYYYDKETNDYARNLEPSDETGYVRGGSLDRIEYGLRSSTMYGVKALAKVDFHSEERCLPQTGVTCDASTIDDDSFYWYDTPWDTNCKDGEDCHTVTPTFWTRKRLTGVTTETLQSDGTYAPVDSWQLTHRWGMADIDYQLLLDTVQHTGKTATPEVTLPKVSFEYDQRANRLDKDGDDTAPFIKERLSTISDESGGQTDVQYSTAACDWDHLPTPETNTTRCYPLYYTAEGNPDPSLQWFNKYVVESVTQTDRTQASPDMVTSYDYRDGAAWHYDDDDGLTKEKYKTWSSWRGYGHVRVTTGGQGDPRSQTDHYFLRGMDGDKSDSSGGTRSVTVSDDNGGTITDHDSAAGFEYKTERYSGVDGTVLAKTVSTPWHHQTAARVRSWGTTTADLTGTASTRTWTSLDDGAGSQWRITYKTNDFENTAGRIVQADDFGDNTTSSDNRCTRTEYADNTSDWILTAPARVETVAVDCDTTPDRSKDVVADVRTAYDGLAYGAAPTKGDTTGVATLKSNDGTTATYLESGSTYDIYGRQLTATDLTATVTATPATAPVRSQGSDGRTTTTAYVPATGFPTTMTVTTPPADPANSATAQTTTTTYDVLRHLPATVLDTNSKRTDITYDALGRTRRVWLPNSSKASNETPNYEFTYTVTDGKPVAVGTTTPKSGTATWTSYMIYDGFLRPRQTQAPGPQGGRLLTDSFHDGRGLVTKTFAPYYIAGPPSTGLLALDDALSVETQTRNTYDGLGRVTTSKQMTGNGDGGQVLATTTTAYHGDRTTVTPSAGGTPTTTVTDAQGRTTELWQYHAATPTGAADKTLYSYDPAGNLTELTDPAGNQWTYHYDQRGLQDSASDPDSGTTTSIHDDRGQLVSTTDARGRKITHVYDGLGREIETHDGGAGGTLLTKHVWDPSGNEGQLASATRYIGGASGSAYTTTVNIYDNLYRPNRTTTTLPASEGALAGSYQFNTKYNVNGTLQSQGYPAAGALTAEAVVPTYDDALRPIALSGSGGVTYTTGTVYSYTGKPLQYTYQSGGKQTQVTNTYQWGTQRLENSRVDRQDVPGVDKSSTYTYDEAGNVLSIEDVSRDGTDNQCFQYDYLGRLTESWAQNTQTCAASPAGSVLGGPAPYWQSYTYDTSGNRLTETLHDPTGNTADDVHRDYTYPPATSPQPHTLTQVQTTGPTGSGLDSYTYDATGNTSTRTTGGNQQSFTWDTEGALTQVTEPTGGGGSSTISYVYDADGNRLIRRTPTGTTAYLGGMEVSLATGSSTPTATRYYDLGGGNQAIRTNDNNVSFLIGDHHGTSELAIAASDLSMKQRRSTPFGAPRGSQPTGWPGEKGFVGGTQDTTTGLTHLGARDYDPATGRFISPDPVLDPDAPQQLNGYAYAANSPVTLSDPTGQCPIDLCGGGEPKGGSDSGEVTRVDRTTPAYQWSPYNIDSQGRVIIRGTNQREIFPGVYVPANWKGADEFQKRFYKYYDDTRMNDPDFLRDNAVNEGARAQIELWKFKICGAMGNCPNSVYSFKSTMEAGLAAGMLFPGRGDGGFYDMGGRPELPGAGSASGVHVPTGGSPCSHSFATGTDVLLADGSTKNIEDVKVGDKVEATQPESGRTGPHKVVATITTRDDKHFADITVHTHSGGDATITATTTHPFWVKDNHTWKTAGTLKPGMHLRTATGKSIRITAVRLHTTPQLTHDLTISGVHTYYVLAGATPVLVHNCGSAQSLADRASEIHGRAGSDIAMEKSTVAVVSAQTPLGVVHVVAGNGRGLNRTQKAMLSGVEVAARNIPGMHAEQNALLFINEMGWSPIAGGASRSVCSDVCAPLIRASGGRITGNVYRNESGTKIRTFEW